MEVNLYPTYDTMFRDRHKAVVLHIMSSNHGQLGPTRWQRSEKTVRHRDGICPHALAQPAFLEGVRSHVLEISKGRRPESQHSYFYKVTPSK